MIQLDYVLMLMNRTVAYLGVCLQICAYSFWYSFILVTVSLRAFAFNRSDNSDTGNHVLPHFICSSNVSYTNLYCSYKKRYQILSLSHFKEQQTIVCLLIWCFYFYFWMCLWAIRMCQWTMFIEHRRCGWWWWWWCYCVHWTVTIQMILLTTFSIRPLRDCRNILRYPKTWKQSSSSANSMFASIAK